MKNFHLRYELSAWVASQVMGTQTILFDGLEAALLLWHTNNKPWREPTPIEAKGFETVFWQAPKRKRGALYN